MPALRQITGYINSALSTSVFSSRVFQSAKYDEIADLVYEEKDGNKIYRPVIIDNDGELHDMGINDIYSLQVYHRQSGLVFEDRQENDFGNEGNTTTETADMMLIVIGDKGRLNVVEQDVASGIWANVPRTLSKAILQGLQLQALSVEPGEVNLDPMQVYAQEYQGVEFVLKPNDFMISMKYKIVTEYNKNCFNICNTN